MRPVTFVSQSLEKLLGYGNSIYSYNLYHALKKIVDVVPLTPPSIVTPPKSYLDYPILIPLTMVFSRAKTSLYHITIPQVGFIIPLFKLLHPRVRIVTTIHDLIPIMNKQGGLRGFLHSFYGWSIIRAIKKSDALIANSSQTKEDIIKMFGTDPKKITVSVLGVDPRFRELPKKSGRPFTIGYVGRIENHKNVKFLIKAFSIFQKEDDSQKRLIIYGRGSAIEECRKLAMELDVEAEFMGFAPDEKLPEIYNSFDLFVFPSETEGFGFPIIEAQKCGVPVIVKTGAHIPKEVTAFCMGAEDESEMADLFMKIRKEGFKFTAAHKAHLEKFSWDRCARVTAEVYAETDKQ